MDTHPLQNKDLEAPPITWAQWLAVWHATNNPLTLHSLIVNGPAIVRAGIEGRDESMIIYLKLATEWWKDAKGEASGLQKKSFATCPKQALAQAAYETLCTHFFEQPHGLTGFLYTSIELIRALEEFLGSASITELGTSTDPLAKLFGRATEKQQATLEKFCLGFAGHLIAEPYYLSQDSDRSETAQRRIDIWHGHQRSAIKILLFFRRYDILVRHAHQLHTTAFDALREYILSKNVSAQWDESDTVQSRKMSDIDRDIHMLNPGIGEDWGSNADVALASYIYWFTHAKWGSHDA